MKLAFVGLSHRTAPIEVRERIAGSIEDRPAALERIRRLDGVNEACLVSTCNRVEIYAAGELEAPKLRRHLRRFVAESAGSLVEQVQPHLVERDAADAVSHLFRMTASLDSMVLGEPQILGQVKDSYRQACDVGLIRRELNPVFERAFSVAKRVRTETGIAENAVSMSYAAVELGRQIFEDLDGREVLLVGAGKMGGLAAKHLWANGVGRIRVANRSRQAAEALASEVGGVPAGLEELPALLASADIVICSTAAPGFVIDKKMVSRVLRHRRYRALLFVDIAVPRDVDPKVGTLDNVFLYDVDDLHGVLEQNRLRRQAEAEAAERMIQAEVARFVAWRNSQQVVPVIKALRGKASQLVQAELQKTLGSTAAGLDAKSEKRVRAMANSIMNKLLHPVLAQLKDDGEHGHGDLTSEAVVRLFQLDLDRDVDVPVAKADHDGDHAGESNVVRLPGS